MQDKDFELQMLENSRVILEKQVAEKSKTQGDEASNEKEAAPQLSDSVTLEYKQERNFKISNLLAILRGKKVFEKW